MTEEKFDVEASTKRILDSIDWKNMNAEEHIYRNHNRELAKSFGKKSDVYKRYSVKPK